MFPVGYKFVMMMMVMMMMMMIVFSVRTYIRTIYITVTDMKYDITRDFLQFQRRSLSITCSFYQ